MSLKSGIALVIERDRRTATPATIAVASVSRKTGHFGLNSREHRGEDRQHRAAEDR